MNLDGFFPARLTVLAVVTGTVLLGGCVGSRRPPPLASRPPANAPSNGYVSPGRAAPAVWELRSGLNVAALTCRGRSRASVAPAYRRMLARHRALLSAAYQEEVHRYGARAFDHQQTRVYNRYSNQRSPERFCRTAASVAQEAGGMPSSRLSPAARGLVAQLQRSLR
ncbi:hypothetical protein RXV95_11895 [Novosphingobium sp. ZN18A2]|uniref:hypothetical protein n=1 Tax=Novosphingobium sp. ZN18A2 TaxID=3079861 RepID=UPI0030D29346